MKRFPTHIVATDGIVENGNGEILLVKNRYRDIWTIPGGQVEVGENLVDALIREIKEESGIDAKVDKLVCVSSNTCTYEGYNGYGMVPTKIILGFVCIFAGGELSVSDEISEACWVDKDMVLDYIVSPDLRKRFEAYLHFDGFNITYLEYVTKPEYELKTDRYI